MGVPVQRSRGFGAQPRLVIMRGLRSTLVLLVVAVGLGAYVYFVEADRPPGGTPEPQDTAFSFESDDITRLMVTAGNGERTVLEKTDNR